MRITKIIFLMTLTLFVACAQSVTISAVKDLSSVPNVSFTSYLYSSGEGERFRAVLLKSPESDIDVIPYSSQIITARGTFEDAVAFMGKAGGQKDVLVQSVSFKGRTFGYLLTFEQHTFAREAIEVNIFERGGNIYFLVTEKKSEY